MLMKQPARFRQDTKCLMAMREVWNYAPGPLPRFSVSMPSQRPKAAIQRTGAKPSRSPMGTHMRPQ